ncbi:hypothetical protein T492DRAFT_871691, partial [Pavlovales sp. CCMP2436]
LPISTSVPTRPSKEELARRRALGLGTDEGSWLAALPAVDLGRNVRIKAIAAGLGYAADSSLTEQDASEQASARMRPIDLGTDAVATAIRESVSGQQPQPQQQTQQQQTQTQTQTRRVVKCWGANAWGELGYGDVRSRGALPGQMGEDLPHVQLRGEGGEVEQVSAGKHYSCALSRPSSPSSPSSGTAAQHASSLYCWGANEWGQLGYGDLLQRGHTPESMAVLPPVPLPAGVLSQKFDSAHCWPWPPPDGAVSA